MASARRLPRLYQVASVSRGSGGFAVMLDGKPLRTPARRPLELPTAHLAWGIAAEWEAQGKHVWPHTMPLMTLATTTVDQVPSIRPTMKASMLRCLQSDTACIRSDERALAAKEASHFDGLLQWLGSDLGLGLATTDSLTLQHPPGALERAEEVLDAADDWETAALDSLTSSCKSLVLALAVERGRIGAEAACKAARVAEQHQIDEWGEVEAGHDLDAADLAVRVSAASLFLQLLRS